MTDTLLSRLQKLTAPSKEIDAEICPYPTATGPELEPICKIPGDILWRAVPRYTASIDTALTLVPKCDGEQRVIWISLSLSQSEGSRGSGRYVWHAELTGAERIEKDGSVEVRDLYWWLVGYTSSSRYSYLHRG
jgi:hypothetical protein